MINVIPIKDIIKYLVRITITLTIVIGLTRYFFNLKTQVNDTKTENKNTFLLSCLNTAIPSLKEVNRQAEKKEEVSADFSPLKMALGVELKMINTINKTEEKSEVQKSEKNDTENKEDTADEKNEEGKAEEKLPEAEKGLKTEVLESDVPEKFTDTYGSVKIRNETDIKLTKEMLTPNVKMNMKDIFIYHTHACESYTPSEKYQYKSSGNFRTKDIERSVIRVGTELETYMKQYGYNVTHDTTLFDYPSYNESYDRSYESVANFLKKNEDTEIFFDIHRDAIRR